MTLTEFLTERLDEEELAWREGGALLTQPEFARFSRHMLADLAAKRALIEMHRDMSRDHDEPDDDEYYRQFPDSTPRPVCDQCTGGDWLVSYPCDNLLILALPYGDHPDYRQEWKLSE